MKLSPRFHCPSLSSIFITCAPLPVQIAQYSILLLKKSGHQGDDGQQEQWMQALFFVAGLTGPDAIAQPTEHVWFAVALAFFVLILLITV